MRAAWLLLGAASVVMGCKPAALTPLCEIYSAGSLTPENNFAVTVEAKDWPALDQANEWIQIGFHTARPLTGTPELVHVAGDQEIERWRLDVPSTPGNTPACRISLPLAPGPCGATVQVHPQKMSGYYYLLANGNPIVEAGLTFKLCRRP